MTKRLIWGKFASYQGAGPFAMSTLMQPSLAGLTGLARRLVSEDVLPEVDVRRAVAESTQGKASLTTWLLDNNLVDSARLTRIASDRKT